MKICESVDVRNVRSVCLPYITELSGRGTNVIQSFLNSKHNCDTVIVLPRKVQKFHLVQFPGFRLEYNNVKSCVVDSIDVTAAKDGTE